jgi:2-haloacid dehalogenase
MAASNPPVRGLEGIRACVFDAYGTLFDFASAAARCEDVPDERRAALTALWRDKQLQYTWLRTLQNRYADFWQVTGEALDFALESLDLEQPALRERLMKLYLSLEPFAEVPSVLGSLRERGFRTAILSNGSPKMLEALVKRSRLEHLFDAVLSADAVGAFKTHPKVYQYALDALGLRSAGERDRLRVLQRLGRARGFGFRHARRVVQPLRPAPRTPSRRAGFRDQDAPRPAHAAGLAGLRRAFTISP